MKSVLVVGAGLSGLTAAVGLIDRGFEVVVLEKSAVSGGRIKQIVSPNTHDAVDAGQHLMLGCYRESLALTRRLSTENRLMRIKGLTPFLSAADRIHPYRSGDLPAPLHTLPGLFGLTQLSISERLALIRAIVAAKIGARSTPDRLDRVNANQWLTKQGQSANAIAGFWEPIVAATLNLAGDDASALLLATVIDRGLFARREDAVPILPQTTLHDLFIGPAETAIRKSGGAVRRGEEVDRLISRDGRYVTAVRLRSGEIREVNFIVLAVPPWDLVHLIKDLPGLESICRDAQSLSFSAIVNIDLWFDRPWLRFPFASFLGSPLQWVFNHHQGAIGAMKGERYRVSLVMSHAEKHLPRSAETLTAEAVAEIHRFFPESRTAHLVDRLVLKFRRATIRAAPGQRALRPPPDTVYRNLFLAGDWTATGLPATIESAVMSGNLVAKRIENQALDGLTEKDYNDSWRMYRPRARVYEHDDTGQRHRRVHRFYFTRCGENS